MTPAIPQLENAQREIPQNRRQPTARRQYHLAMAYLKSGDARRAETRLRAPLVLDPNLAGAREARNRIRSSAER